MRRFGYWFHNHWNNFDFESQIAIIITILAVVGILAVFGLIKCLTYFYKLPRKQKKDTLFNMIGYSITSFGLTYLVLYYSFPTKWNLSLEKVLVIYLGGVLLFLASIGLNNSAFKKTDTEGEKKNQN